MTELAKTYTRDMALRFPLMPGSHEIAWRHIFDWAICGEALNCAPGDIVLEFAAGPGYVSEFLNRLGYRTIALDIDPEILSFARERLSMDQRLDPKRAVFVCGDGQHLPFRDASIDGVITLNALHHMPDYRATLAEIHRILKPGARASFSEPGANHADAPESRLAAEQYGAVEKSVHLDEVYRLAREVGFENMILKPFVHPGLVEVEYREFSNYRRNASSARLTRPDQIAHHFLNFHTIFALTVPGRKPLTSVRAGVENGLRAGLRVDHVTESAAPGDPVAIRVLVKNSGSHTWLSQPREFGGHVVMGIKLCRADGRMIRSLSSTLLRQDVAPGEAVEIERSFLLPWLEPGSYLIKFDMVAEEVGWFEQFGSAVVTRTLRVLPGPVTSACPKVLHAEIAVAGLPEVARPGEEIKLTATVRNCGDTPWLSQPREHGGHVAMGIKLCRTDGQVAKELSSTLLPQDVAPGEAVEIERCFLLPWLEPDSYLIKFDMVAEEVGWFEQFGSAVVTRMLRVLPGPVTSASPKVLHAEIAVAGLPAVAQPGDEISLAVTVRNSGDTLWISRPRECGGHVALGIIFLLPGRRNPVSIPQVLLPHDVTPGEEIVIKTHFLLPWLEEGSYEMKFDLLAEQVGWFQEFGSTAFIQSLRVLPGLVTSACPRILRAEIAVAGLPETARPGDAINLAANVQNCGDTLWLSQPRECGGHVTFGIRFCLPGSADPEGFSYIPIHYDVAPGEEIAIKSHFLLPWLEEGSYEMKFDMLAEKVGWFQEFGSPAVIQPLTVLPGPVTSACPRILRAEIAVAGLPETARPGDPINLVATVRNCGDTLWLSQQRELGGHVALGIEFCTTDGEVIKKLSLALLHQDVAPGETVVIETRFLLPWLEGDTYEMKFDMVAEQVGWFQEFGSVVVTRLLSVLPGPVTSACPKVLCAEIAVAGLPENALPGDAINLVAKVHNCGDTLWLSQPREEGGHVTMAIKFCRSDGEVVMELSSTLLHQDVAPGEEIMIERRFLLPWLEDGAYEMKFDMVAEKVGWFQEFGSVVVTHELTVLPGPVTSACPKVLCADIAVGGLPEIARPGDEISLVATVRNCGDTLWLSQPRELGGQVALGIRFSGIEGQVIKELSFALLDQDVMPGEEVVIERRFLLPWLEEGPYEMKFDMVANEVGWFREFGSEVVTRPLSVLPGVVTSACPKDLRAEIMVDRLPKCARAGDEITVHATVRNIGDTLWLSTPRESGGHVTFGVNLIAPEGNLVSEALGRTNLPQDVAPGEQVEIESTFQLPATLDPGIHLLHLDMVDEQIVWFGQLGSAAVERELMVESGGAAAEGNAARVN